MSGNVCHQGLEFELSTLTYLLGVGVDVLEAHRHKGVVLVNAGVDALRGLGCLRRHIDVSICVFRVEVWFDRDAKVDRYVKVDGGVGDEGRSGGSQI